MIKKSYNRILEISKDHKQITLPDSRYYRRNGEYYPSVTYILNSYPKGKYFEDWLKRHGYTADYIVKKSAEEGTLTHELIEAYLNGEEINYLDSKGNPTMNVEVYQTMSDGTQGSLIESYKDFGARDSVMKMFDQTAPGFVTLWAEKRMVSTVRDPFAGVYLIGA